MTPTNIQKMDLGLIGLGVMGKNLVLNFIDKGYTVSVYNRTIQKALDFETEVSDTTKLKAFSSIEKLVSSLHEPRVVIILVQAGDPVDYTCNELKKYVSGNDIVMDFGNSNYQDTMKRCAEYMQNFCFIGCGISGGEEGARYGPSLMPGGNVKGWKYAEKMLKDVSAKYVKNGIENPCCEWIGESGAGHFVKMVHNGMEYGDMGIISEAYSILKGSEMENEEIRLFFEKCNEFDELKGYLIEITAKILKKKDENGVYYIDKIEDKAGNKGTGLWSIKAAMDCSYYATLMTSAVFSRMISHEKSKRELFSENKEKCKNKINIKTEDLISAMILAKAISYIQGINLIKKTSDCKNWKINLKEVCNVWKNGCIIRGGFLEIVENIVEEGDYENTKIFQDIYKKHIKGLRNIVLETVKCQIPSICFTSCLSFLDSIGTKRGNGNMIQALRDYFGAHNVRFLGCNEDVHVDWQ